MARIISVGTSIPDVSITNEHVLSLVMEHSRSIYKGDIEQLASRISTFLLGAGAKRRRWRSGSTRPLEHIADAWQNCLATTDPDVIKRIGVLIYCGIDKGIVEPSHASLIAQHFGLATVRTLDISDACMGWFTATQVASNWTTPERPYALIIAAEFPLEMPGKVFPEAFRIRDEDDLAWKGAALTLGECAAVTLIVPSSSHQVSSVFKSNNSLADICCVPLERPDRFVGSKELIVRLSDNCFVANMGKMAAAGYRDAQDVLKTYISRYGTPDIILPHTVSQTMPEHISKNVLPVGTLRNCFEEFGNIATCSIPVGYEYFDCKDRSESHIAGWIAAAGMSHCVFRLRQSEMD